MICKNSKWNKWMGWAMLALGIVSFLYGLISFIAVKPQDKATNTLLGMFTGFGFGIICVAVGYTIRQKLVSKEKLEQEEIDRYDERNIAIARSACTVGMITAIIMFAALAFAFMGMGLMKPSYMCIGSMYVVLLVTKIAQKKLEKKM